MLSNVTPCTMPAHGRVIPIIDIQRGLLSDLDHSWGLFAPDEVTGMSEVAGEVRQLRQPVTGKQAQLLRIVHQKYCGGEL